MGPRSLCLPQPLHPALSQRPSHPGCHREHVLLPVHPQPLKIQPVTAQPALTHTGLMTMPCRPCPLWPTSASHLQQQTRGQLQLFPLQHPTLSLPAQPETGAVEHNQEKQFSFRAAKLSRARSSGLGWPLPAMADTRPSPVSAPYLLFHPGWTPSL